MARWLRENFNRLASGFNRRSIRYTVFLSFTLTALLAILLTGLSYYARFTRQIDSISEAENRIIIDQANQSLRTYLRNMIHLTDSLSYNVVKNHDLATDPISEELQLLYDVNSSYIENIAIFSISGEMLAAAPPARLRPQADVRVEPWFIESLEKSENIHFYAPTVQKLFQDADNQYSWVITISCAVEVNFGKETQQGVLLINLKYSAAAEILKNVSLPGGGYIYLTDADGEIIYHPDSALIASGLRQENNMEAAALHDGTHQMEFQEEERTVIVRSVGYTGWKIIGVVPHQMLVADRLQNTLFVIMLLLLYFDILIAINGYLSNRLTNPIKELERSVQALEQDAVNAHIYLGGSYEIRHLGRSIQRMVDQMRRLTDEIVAEHAQKQKSELNALQSQINPHFLYNTLDIIVWMVEKKQPEEAVRIVTALARFFRISLSGGRNIISVRDELEHVQNYLTIQKSRYKNKFTYTIRTDEETRAMATIKLVVQPLVENAIYHSMDFMDGDGEIDIEARVADGELCITVRDNGLGMTEDVVARLLNDERPPISKSGGSGIGLRNVQERIRLYFGEAYGVNIYSEPDVGTTITLRMPAVLYTGQEEKL